MTLVITTKNITTKNPGADVGNRTKVVEMHEGSQPFWETPQIITTKHAPLEAARQAYELSRR